MECAARGRTRICGRHCPKRISVISPCARCRRSANQTVVLWKEGQPVCPCRQQGWCKNRLGVPSHTWSKCSGLRAECSGVASHIVVNAKTQLASCCRNIEAQALNRCALRQGHLLCGQSVPVARVIRAKDLGLANPNDRGCG